MAKRPTTVTSVVAYEGAGKTKFWIDAPGQKAVISTDTNTETTIRKELNLDDDDEIPEDQIKLCQIEMPAMVFDDRDEVQDEASNTWEKCVDFLRPLIKDEDERPDFLVFDTANDVYDLRVLAEIGKLDQISPEQRRNYLGKCNTSYKGLIQAAKSRGISVILIHRAADKWVDKTEETQSGPKDVRVKLNGPFDMERDKGFKGTGFITEVEVFLAFNHTRAVDDLAEKYGMYVARCTRRPGLIGQKFWGTKGDVHKASYAFLMSKVFPKTRLKDWQ